MENTKSLLIELCSKKSNPCAVIDSNLQILWSKNKPLIESAINHLCLKHTEIFSEERETLKSVETNGEIFSASLTPVSVGETRFFILELYADMYLKSMISCSSFWSKTADSLDIIYSGISRIVQSSEALKLFIGGLESEQYKNELAACERQLNNSINALIEIMRITAIYKSDDRQKGCLCLEDVMDVLAEKTQDEFLGVRSINYHRKNLPGNDIAVSEQRFTIAVMGLISNAIFYSPKGSAIDIELHIHHPNAYIVISNSILDESLLPYRENRANMGLKLAEIVFYEAGGKVTFQTEDNTARTEVLIPLLDGNNKIVFHSPKKSLKSASLDKFSTPSLFLRSIKISENEKK